LQLNHSGHYHCQGLVNSGVPAAWQESVPVTVTVHGVPLSGVSLWVQPIRRQVTLGDHLVLRCVVATGTGPLSFTWLWTGSGRELLGTGPHLELQHVG
ncbi:FCRL1 protein, partial [Leiothrix lutea]|nr:FCRL1 protein [Leiothrix lutea]